ncbi:S8 family serine peptidase [Streptomyces spiralis]
MTWRDVTLVTGDGVRLGTMPDGMQIAEVRPGAGRGRMTFVERARGKSLSVIPADAAPLVAAGKLDPRLFDVSDLMRDGYGDSARPDLPLIVGHRPAFAGTSGPATVSLSGTRTTRQLPSLHAEALVARKCDAGTFWQSLTDGHASLRPGFTHMWLDGTVHARLDRSVPQIGAPTAWDAGFTEKGVRVGVLDTGIDQEHPDLSDAVAETKDFTGDPDGALDGHGHGTHVASIITGSGAASGERLRGVAPDAQLVVGKVLDDQGQGTFSQIIAGMEWEASRHVKVVNMSLGADLASDGTDPVSAAVDALTQSSGTLFVVAAGNAGPGTSSVGIPAVAESALTVGAVDGSDAMADFSSVGPRPGDDGVKPDLTAPGVGIVAARAQGTTLDEPVDDFYIRASGTSMATPHVAGAAAISPSSTRTGGRSA